MSWKCLGDNVFFHCAGTGNGLGVGNDERMEAVPAAVLKVEKRRVKVGQRDCEWRNYRKEGKNQSYVAGI